MSIEPGAREAARYVEVAVATGPALPRRAGSGLPGVFTYQVPDGLSVAVGSLVEVPFGARRLAGLVTGFVDDAPSFPTRPITRPLSDDPLVSGMGVALASFVARTYRAPLFECLCLVLPPGFAARLDRTIRAGSWNPPRGRLERAEPELARPSPAGAPAALTTEQRAARDAIVAAFRVGRHQPFLLYGVTGSGKTLVYLEAVGAVVAAGRQAIVLVSEIGLTPELLARFRERFPRQTAVLHSRLSAAEHRQNWQVIAEGRARVVIGSRSAIFAPAQRLGLVVLDEEHEWTYKQDSSPRYHAREVALELGRLAEIPVVLSSATPDVGTTWRALVGELSLLPLRGRYRPPGRADEARLPPVEVVDLRQELRAGNAGIFSRALRHELSLILARGEQAILYINRRGTATCVICRSCGHVACCRRCEIPFVYHRVGEQLICHRCNRRRPPLQRCPGCGGSSVRQLGVGTQRVEQELASLFPEARVVRWDRDAGRAGGELWREFHEHQADLLVGTQLVAKALDFPLVTLVGVVLADVGLFLPDFRAAERSFQLLTQVAGRAGRGERPGRVVVQTYAPGHYAVQLAAAHDYRGFYRREVAFRQAQGYPPFGRLARFVYSGSDEQRCWREAGRLRRVLQDRIDALGDPELRLIGPAPCYAQRVRGRYRWQLIARGETFDGLLDGLVLAPGWIIDVDPVSLL